MEISVNKQNTSLKISLSGRLDTSSAPSLESELQTALDAITDLELDFSALEYISSAGLRVLLSTQKRMNKQGNMVISHANESIREIFDITGFADILTLVD